jgi:UDP-2-acetamido-2-deoxy-ribo-hexuluronate aminotransferase
MNEALQMVDLVSQYERLKPELEKGMNTVLESAHFIGGPMVQSFTKELASFTKSSFVIPCANGTDALQIAFMALDLKPGEEVLVPAFTYIATVEVLELLKLKPVLVDVREDDFNMDIAHAEKLISDQTKAILPVHLFGQCADMEPILELAQKHKLHVVEDAAQAIGATYTFSDGTVRQAGCMGDIGTTSFFPSKNLGCYGDGGAIFAQDEYLANRLKQMANHGQTKKYHHGSIGVNSRLDALQAAVLRVKLRHLKDFTEKRQTIAQAYREELIGIPQIELPATFENRSHVYHQFTLKVERRDVLKSFLQDKGIPSMVYYPMPIYKQEAYEKLGKNEASYPISEHLPKKVLSLPICPEKTEEQIHYICTQIKAFYSQK